MSTSLAALAATVALGLPLTGSAAGPELSIPNFSHLASRARDSVDITLDGFLLRIAQKFAAADGENGDELAILRDIKSVRVRNFEFDSKTPTRRTTWSRCAGSSRVRAGARSRRCIGASRRNTSTFFSTCPGTRSWAWR
jgi:hypothetical protein